MVPFDLFRGSGKLDKSVLSSNPRVYIYPDFDPSAEPLLVVGMDGWGGRSENFILPLVKGLEGAGLTRRLVIASIQDTETGGPRYQGQGDREHANVWSLTSDSVTVMDHFLAGLAKKLGPMKVYLIGYSTGGAAAPVLGTALARRGNEAYRVEGSVALGTGSFVSLSALRETGQRVLFVVVPQRRAQDKVTGRDDQGNRQAGELAYERLSQGGDVEVYLRHIESARRHVDWHWGVLSQCRYFKGSRIDSGRGYWPNYLLPNPETFAMVSAFVAGGAPPESATDLPLTPCAY